MKLLGSLRSPYVRKVLIMAKEKGVAVEFVESSASGPQVAAANPLSKVPALIRDDGRGLYDSSVIVDYLDGLKASPKLIPAAFEDRIEVRRWEALGNGVMDALIEITHDNRMPEGQRKGPEYVAKQSKKVDAALAAMEKDLGARAFCHGDCISLADVACGAALNYLDRALPDANWRATHPALARLMERLGARDSFKNT